MQTGSTQLAGSYSLTQAARPRVNQEESRINREEQLKQVYKNRLHKTESIANVVQQQKATANPMLAVTKIIFAGIAATTAFAASRTVVYNNLSKHMSTPINNFTGKASKVINSGLTQLIAHTKEGSKVQKLLTTASNKLNAANPKITQNAAKVVTKPIEILAGAGSAASVAKVALKGNPEEALTELQNLGDQVDGKIDGKMGDVPLY